MGEVTGLREKKLTLRRGEGCGNQTPLRYRQAEERRKRDTQARGRKEEHTRAHAHTRADTGRISVSREWGRGRVQEREVGLDDIMCCYSPAECWQEDF